jgi:hypothetical protein
MCIHINICIYIYIYICIYICIFRMVIYCEHDDMMYFFGYEFEGVSGIKHFHCVIIIMFIAIGVC